MRIILLRIANINPLPPKNALFLLLLLASATLSVFAQKPKNPNPLKKYSKELQKVILTEKGVFRGVDFGMAKEQVMQLEKEPLSHQSDSTLVYTLYLDAENSADILYFLDEKKTVKAFSIIFILSDTAEEHTLSKNLISYYTSRYGACTLKDVDDEVWTAKGYTIEMNDTSDEAGVEIEVEYKKEEEAGN